MPINVKHLHNHQSVYDIEEESLNATADLLVYVMFANLTPSMVSAFKQATDQEQFTVNFVTELVTNAPSNIIERTAADLLPVFDSEYVGDDYNDPQDMKASPEQVSINKEQKLVAAQMSKILEKRHARKLYITSVEKLRAYYERPLEYTTQEVNREFNENLNLEIRENTQRNLVNRDAVDSLLYRIDSFEASLDITNKAHYYNSILVRNAGDVMHYIRSCDMRVSLDVCFAFIRDSYTLINKEELLKSIQKHYQVWKLTIKPGQAALNEYTRDMILHEEQLISSYDKGYKTYIKQSILDQVVSTVDKFTVHFTPLDRFAFILPKDVQKQVEKLVIATRDLQKTKKPILADFVNLWILHTDFINNEDKNNTFILLGEVVASTSDQNYVVLAEWQEPVRQGSSITAARRLVVEEGCKLIDAHYNKSSSILAKMKQKLLTNTWMLHRTKRLLTQEALQVYLKAEK